MKTLPIVGLIALSLLQGAGANAQKREAAQLLNAKGDVLLIRDGKTISEHARSLTVIYEGDIVQLKKEARSQILLSDGSRISIASNSRVRVGGGKVVSLQGGSPKAMPSLGKNLVSSASELKGSLGGRLGGIVLRNDGNPDGLHDPLPVGAVKKRVVTLSWSGESAEKIDLSVTALGSKSEIFSKSLPRKSRFLDLPEGLLKPGEWYSWKIASLDSKGVKTQTGSLIRLLSAEDEGKRMLFEKEAKAAMKRNPKEATPHILLARAYESLGLFQEAGSEYATAQELDPQDVTVDEALERLKM